MTMMRISQILVVTAALVASQPGAEPAAAGKPQAQAQVNAAQKTVTEAAYVFQSPDKNLPLEINLVVKNGTCTMEKPSIELVRRSKKVTWWVTNDCPGDPRTVQLSDFVPKGATAAEWPFQEATSAAKCQASAGGGTCRIPLTVLNAGPNGKRGAWVYQYTIGATGIAGDPEIVIEWP